MAAGANGPMKYVGLTGVERNRQKPQLKSVDESLSQRPTTGRTPQRDKRTLDELDPPLSREVQEPKEEGKGATGDDKRSGCESFCWRLGGKPQVKRSP